MNTPEILNKLIDPKYTPRINIINGETYYNVYYQNTYQNTYIATLKHHNTHTSLWVDFTSSTFNISYNDPDYQNKLNQYLEESRIQHA